jgi:hypothetical protein
MAGYGWLWPAMTGYGWLWLAMAGYDWLWLAMPAMTGYGWLWLAMAGYGWLWPATAVYGWLWVAMAIWPRRVMGGLKCRAGPHSAGGDTDSGSLNYETAALDSVHRRAAHQMCSTAQSHSGIAPFDRTFGNHMKTSCAQCTAYLVTAGTQEHSENLRARAIEEESRWPATKLQGSAGGKCELRR